MSNFENNYNDLTHFLGSYFHQDWVDEFECPDEALENAMNSEPLEFIQKVLKELKQLNSLSIENENILIELGCYYSPEADGLSMQNWLKKVEEDIKAFLGK